MAGFGFLRPQPVNIGTAGVPKLSDLSWADKLMAIGGILQHDPSALQNVQMMAIARQAQQQKDALTQQFGKWASGEDVPSISRVDAPAAPAMPPPPPSDPVAAAASRAFGSPTEPSTSLPSAPRLDISIPSYQVTRTPLRQGPISMRGAIPMLTQMARAGVNVDPYVKMIEGAQPKSVVVNGRVLDENDPSSYGRFYGEAPAKGAEPVYDRNGNEVGWRTADGALSTIAAAKAAEVGAEEATKARYVGPNAAAAAAGAEAGKAPYALVTKDVNGVPTTMTQAQALTLAGTGAGADGGQGGAPGGGLDPRAFYNSFVLKHEGGLNPSDMNGSPTKYGINQKANPSVDVRGLTPDGAADIFTNKYFGPSGAANLPPALAAVHADTAFINPSKAQQFLKASGGDPGKYMDLREAWMANMVANNPAAQRYEKAWATRNADLRNVAGQLAGQSAPAAPRAGGDRVASPGTPSVGFHGLNADDAKKLATYQEDARTAEDVVQKAHQFQRLNTQQASGPGYRPMHIPIPLLDKVDLNFPGALARQYQTGVPAMEGLSMKIAAGLRAPGQRLTQAEIMTNLNRVPSVNNLPGQNDTLVKDYEDTAATKRAYANFMSDWLAQHGSLTGADTAWAAGQRQGGHGATAAGQTSRRGPTTSQQVKTRTGAVVTVTPME
jgi:hypothetical protein